MIIRPRLNDFFKLPFTQTQVDFAIPFLEEDIPLYVDPFLLWKSPSQADNALHRVIVESFNYIGSLYLKDESAAIKVLKEISECEEVGLGNSRSKKGTRIGDELAKKILDSFKKIPHLKSQGYTHIEEVQFLVEGFSKDRISDISCNLIKSYLIDYTIQKCKEFNIPTTEVEISFFSLKKKIFVTDYENLPTNPESNTPILFVPKRWLRKIHWLNFDTEYFESYLKIANRIEKGLKIPRIEILTFNRKNFDAVLSFIQIKEREQQDCKNDPLFSQLPITSSKRKLNAILKLPTGKLNKADVHYENDLCPLLASMFYPDLDFAAPQSRTDSNTLIRDLVFYNNTSHKTLKEIYTDYDSRQIVIELKNVKEVTTTHVNQLNRYLSNNFGRFGILFTRNRPPRTVLKNTIDLWAGQRKCILIMDDEDLKLMCQVYESKNRKPIDVLTKKLAEFIRKCPS